MKMDCVIDNGRLLDPKIGLDMNGCLAVKGRKIAGHSVPPDAERKWSLNAAGGWILPGFIDVHTHCNWLGNHIGLPVDLACIPSGVTTAIDAGSTGVSNYRGLLRTLDGCLTRTRILLHVSAAGQMMSAQFNENVDPSVWDRELFEQAFEQYGDRIVGLKIRISRDVVGPMGLHPLNEAVKLAGHLGARLFVHSTNPPAKMAEVAALLRPGDVVCHMFHGAGSTIVDGNRVDPGIVEARKRGVIFDVSQGKFNFNINVARVAIGEGFLPDTISTDLSIATWNNPLDFSLPMCMSKHMALGMAFSDIVRCVTANAALLIGREGELGTLAAGSAADIAVVRIADHPIEFRDIHGNSIRGEKLIEPLAAILDGRLLFRSPYTL